MRYIKIVFLSIILYNCSSNEIKIQDSLFNIEGLNTNIESIKSQGYSWERGIDIIVYSKKVKDTLISLEIENHSKGIISTKTWKIKIESDDYNLIYKSMLEKDVFPNGPIAYYDNNEGYFFTVIRNSDNNIFICKVLNEDNFSYLYITYHIPKLGVVNGSN